MQSPLKEPSFLIMLHSRLQSRAMKHLTPRVHWAPGEDNMQHAQGVVSRKPVSAGVDEVCMGDGQRGKRRMALCPTDNDGYASQVGVGHSCPVMRHAPTGLEGRQLLAPLEHSP